MTADPTHVATRLVAPAIYDVVVDGKTYRAAIRPLPSSDGALALAFGAYGPGQPTANAGELAGLLLQQTVARAALASVGLVAAGFPARQAVVGGLAVSLVIEAFAVGYFAWQKAELLSAIEQQQQPGEASGPTVEVPA